MYDLKNSIEWRQLDLLIKNTRSGFLFAFLYICFFYLVIPEQYPKTEYVIWALVYTTVLIYKYAIVYKFDRVKQNGIDIVIWQRLYDLGQFFSGLCFLYLFTFFSSSWPIFNQIMFWILMMSFITGGVALFSVKLSSYLFLAMPPIAAAIYTGFSYREDSAPALAFILFMVGLAIIISAIKCNKIFYELCLNQKLLAETNKKLESIASKDPLTRLPNRRAYDEYFQSEWDRHKRSASILSLMIIDVDHFKEYNDHYGHSEGDTCLIRIANIINTNLKRPGDLACRYGGEEFAVILPDTSYQGALEVAERIRTTILELKIPHEYSEVLPFVTVSIGVSSIDPNDDNDMQSFFDQTDKQLYLAKQSGRNKVCIDTDSILKPEIAKPS